MPIYDYACYTCKEIKERFVKHSDKDTQACTCGKGMVRLVSAPAKTAARWGDCSYKDSGINGRFDRGLGAYYKNTMERDAICKAKGLIPLEDVGGDSFIENRMAAELNIKAEQDKILQSYKDKVAEYGGSKAAQVRAIEEILPAKDCLGNEGNVAILGANTFTGEKVDQSSKSNTGEN